jgi:hypothetical protein
MDITQILAVSIQTTGTITEPPSPAFPAGRRLVVQRVTPGNANFALPGGQLVSVYPLFIPRNPRTPAQQQNRRDHAAAVALASTGAVPMNPQIARIMKSRNLPRWHATVSWLRKH